MRKQLLLGFLLATGSALVAQSMAQAGFRENLLAQENRPSVEEVLSVLPNPDSNPFTPCGADGMMAVVSQSGPRLIAEVEYSFPGAKWAPLGRDSALAGDVLEAFALHYGQLDRVVRLNASGPSFTSEATYLGLLQASGLVDEKGNAIDPFIILDPTSWQTTSQIRKLIASVYGSKSDAQRRNLISTVNAMAIGNSGKNGGGYSAAVSRGSRETFLNPTSFRFGPDGAPAGILYTVGDFSYPSGLCGSGELSWHNSFLGMQKQADGKWVAKPGSPLDSRTREHILWRMVEIAKITATPAYQAAVIQAGQGLGIDIDQSMTIHFHGATTGPDLPEAGPDLEITLRDLVQNQKKKTFLRERRKQLASLNTRAEEIGKLQLDLPEMVALGGLMSEPNRDRFYWEAIGHSTNLDRTISLVESATGGKEHKNLGTWITVLMAAHPNIEQMNRIATLAYVNPDNSVRFLERALDQIKTPEDFRKLRKPMFAAPEVKHVINAFKKAHPERTKRQLFQKMEQPALPDQVQNPKKSFWEKLKEKRHAKQQGVN